MFYKRLQMFHVDFATKQVVYEMNSSCFKRNTHALATENFKMNSKIKVCFDIT